MKPYTLREDQQSLKSSTYSDWQHGAQNVLDVLSTGGGKSVIMSDMVYDSAYEDKQQLIFAHRNELVSQMSSHVARYGIPHRIIGSAQTVAQVTRQHRELFGQSFVSPSAKTAVGGVDTILSRREELEPWLRQTDRWFGDEAHHILLENKWGKVVDLMPRAQGLGVTATPLRADGQGLGRHADGVFDTMNVGLEMRQLIDLDALADYEIVCPESDMQIEDEKTGKDGDWSRKKLKTASQKSHIVGDVVQAYAQYALGKQAICFATDVETAGQMAKRFNSAGIRAQALSAQTPFAVREKFIKEFRNGTLKILVNVDLFDEGFDVPACEVVIMARPTMSLGKYRQMVGRALRAIAGKAFGLIIDHVSNVKRHGYPDKVIPWTLDRRDKRGKQEKDPEELELTICKNIHCRKPYDAFETHCPWCGKAPPLPEPQNRTIEMVDGDLVLLDRAALAQLRANTVIESAGALGARLMPGYNSQSLVNKRLEKCEAQQLLKDRVAQWAGYQRAAGMTDRQIDKKFYLTTGMTVPGALDATRNTKEFLTISETVEGWYTT